MRFPRLAAAIALATAIAPAAALAQSKPRMLTIPADSGYGIAECFAPGVNCGKVVADAYCEAHGFGAALAYGKSEDVTASIVAASTTSAPAKDSLVVACGD